MAETLGSRLKSLRAEKAAATGRKLTADEVADAVGIERSTLSGYENDLDTPGYQTFVALADYYGVSLDWLAKGGVAESPDEALRKAAAKAGITPEALDAALAVIRLASGLNPALRQPPPAPLPNQEKIVRKRIKA